MVASHVPSPIAVVLAPEDGDRDRFTRRNEDALPSGARVVVCTSGRAVLVVLNRDRVSVVIVPSLDALGDGCSADHLLAVLRAVRDAEARLIVGDLAPDHSAGVLDLASALERLRRASIRASVRRASRVGRPRTKVDVDRARRLRSEGRSWREVSGLLGVAPSTIRRHLSAG